MKKFKYLIIVIVLVILLAALAFFAYKTFPYYKNSETYGMTNIVINNTNVTLSLKKELIIKDDVIFLSKQDVSNFFDRDIYYNSDEQRIVTASNTKVASLLLDNQDITVNGNNVTLKASAFKSTDTSETVYLPFSELKDVYNVEINYNKDSDIITIDSLSREQIKADVSKNTSVKSHPRALSKTVESLKKSDSVIFISSSNGWSKIRINDGTIGYVNDNVLSNKVTTRENFVETPQIEGKINMVWDYYSEYAPAPNRTGTKIDGVNVVSPTLFELKKSGKGEIIDKVGESGKKYIEWAKSNNYKVWGLISKEDLNETTSEILNSYSLRTKLIDNIVNIAVKYDLDGINVDFEGMYKKDKDMFSQFIIELYPRLKDKNLVLSVDVTAPDGDSDWSECYDRLVIGRNCDYVVFMAYDQYGDNSTKPGTTAGYDWVMANVNKFLKSGGIDEVPAEKLILGIPFYTKIWTQDASGKVIKASNNTVPVADMKNVYNVIPEVAKITWLDGVRQNYAEWTSGAYTKKVWIEDEKSIREKLSIIRDKNLAGAAFWAKGREAESIWNVIQEELSK